MLDWIATSVYNEFEHIPNILDMGYGLPLV